MSISSGVGYINTLYQSDMIMVGDVMMSVKEYKKRSLLKKKAKSKGKKCTSITVLSGEVKSMMRNVRVLKSLVAYHTHGYKQWGRIASMLMGLREIKKPFDDVVIGTKQSIRLVEKICKMSNENDKDVFQYIKKLSWKLDDVKNDLDLLVRGINSSGVISHFGSHECINGIGKRLGLRVLTQRSRKAVEELSYICMRLDDIEERGMDVFEYHSNGKQVKI